MNSAAEDKPSTPLASFVLMGATVVGTLAFLFFSILARRRYGKFFDERGLRGDLSLPAQFFLDVPAPVYAAVFILFMAALIVKELAIDRKRVTLRINLGAFGLLAAVVVLWHLAVRFPALRIEGTAP